MWSKDAKAENLIKSFHLPSGISATCVLKTPFNSSFDADVIRSMNVTRRRDFRLISRYFDAACESVFVGGLQLMNFVPPASVLSPRNDTNCNNDGMFSSVTYGRRKRLHNRGFKSHWSLSTNFEQRRSIWLLSLQSST